VIVGLAYLNPDRVQGFRYEAKSGTAPSGTLAGGRSRASVDGNVIAGWDDLTGSGTGTGFWYGSNWWQGLQRLVNPKNGS
jgi:hypothetical protein